MDWEQQLHMDVEAHLRSAFGDEYGGCFSKSFIAAVVEDVKLSSAYDDGHYSDTDIRWAVARTVLGLLETTHDTPKRRRDCLSCANSFSLPSGEPYDDGSVCEHDRLVCLLSHSIISEDNTCTQYHD